MTISLCFAQRREWQAAYPSNTSTVQVHCNLRKNHAGPHLDTVHDQEWE